MSRKSLCIHSKQILYDNSNKLHCDTVNFTVLVLRWEKSPKNKLYTVERNMHVEMLKMPYDIEVS